MAKPPIRAVTIGIAEPHPLTGAVIEHSAAAAHRAAATFRSEGYEVQTVRLSTRPVFDDLDDASPGDLVAYGAELQQMLESVDIEHASVGPAPAHRRGYPLDRLDAIPDLLMGAPSVYCTVQLATFEEGAQRPAAERCAQIVGRLATESEEGFGNFRFAVLACMSPGSPFLPAGYHAGPASLSIGWQGAGIVAAAVEAASAESLTDEVRAALINAGRPIVDIGERMAGELGVLFGGIDLSPAPLGDDSIGRAFELCGPAFGAPGTLATAGALTAALANTGLPTCGYNGLMLPVMEDSVLAARWAEGRVNIHQLLAYSAICGTGLDAVPLPGDASDGEIGALLMDLATLAVRLRKPLSARLMKVARARRGDWTTFSSPLVVNTRI
jgi:uncharacterized protein (UPF0210 family)